MTLNRMDIVMKNREIFLRTELTQDGGRVNFPGNFQDYLEDSLPLVSSLCNSLPSQWLRLPLSCLFNRALRSRSLIFMVFCGGGSLLVVKFGVPSQLT